MTPADEPRDWASRVRAALGAGLDADVVEELAQHAAASYAAARAEGAGAGEAAAAVEREIQDWARERPALARRPRRPPLLEAAPGGASRLAGLLFDVRHAARALFRQRGHSSLVVLTMAVGIGVTTTLFSVVDGVLLKPLPWLAAERLVSVSETREGATRDWGRAFTSAAYHAWRDAPATIEGLAGWRTQSATLDGAGEPARLRYSEVTPSLFGLLRVRAVLGTTFGPAEAGDERTLLLSEGLWEERFGRDPQALGRLVRLDGEPYRILGVMPRGFAFPDRESRAWTRFDVPPVVGADGRSQGLSLFPALARLRPGVTPEQAAQEATARSANAPAGDLAALALFGSKGAIRVSATPLLDSLTAEVRPALLLLLAAVGLLLATATANVAGLQLARATARRRELALRSALGAGRGRLALLLLIESALVGGAGGVAGLALAAAAQRALPALLPPEFPRIAEIALDLRVAAFAAALALVTGILFGLAPALFAGRLRLAPALAEDGAGSVGAGRSGAARARAAILAGQMAIACVLLLGAVQLGRSFLAQLDADRGYDTSHVLVARLPLPDSLYTPERRGRLMSELLARIRAVPLVEQAAFTNVAPLSASEAVGAFTLRPLRDGEEPRRIHTAVRTVSPGYFEALRRPLVEGRPLGERDVEAAPAAVVVNRTFARRYLDGRALGALLPLSIDERSDWEVVGVVEDALGRALAEPAQPELIVAAAQRRRGLRMAELALLVRTRESPQALAPIVRDLLREQDATLVPEALRTLDDVVQESLARPRLYSVLLAGFAACALAIAAVGLFGVLSYAVALRTREIGVRVALGARPGDVVRLVAGRGLGFAGLGLAVGLLVSLGFERVLGGLLFGVRPNDLASVVGVGALLALVAGVASALPARRAARIDPLRALREG